MYVCMYVHVCIMCVCECMYVCVCVCMYVSIARAGAEATLALLPSTDLLRIPVPFNPLVAPC
jgi:hypothetical protein